MPTCSPIEELADYPLEVTVYGLTRRESAGRLVRALAAIPYFPKTIFKIDRLGRLFGVVDHLDTSPILYVQVRHWGREPDRLPDIGWTTYPTKLSKGMAPRASRKLMDYKSAVRSRPMILRYSGKSHCELAARMAIGAS
jgi:hypothetical protein